jgi:carboxyl-terminal processing protease
MARSNIFPDALTIFDRVPRSKLVLPSLAIKFLAKTSIFRYPEALGRRDWHGRTAILVDGIRLGAILRENAAVVSRGRDASSHRPGRFTSRALEIRSGEWSSS